MDSAGRSGVIWRVRPYLQLANAYSTLYPDASKEKWLRRAMLFVMAR